MAWKVHIKVEISFHLDINHDREHLYPDYVEHHDLLFFAELVIPDVFLLNFCTVSIFYHQIGEMSLRKTQ